MLRLLRHCAERNPGARIQAKDLQPLSERLGAFPDLPHVSAFGSRQTQVAFNALMAPRSTPPAVRDALATAVRVATEDAAFVKAHENLGMTIKFMGPAELLEYIERLERTIIPAYRDWRPA
jgi:tripartite-type tricarboxylate transporter receptor subunit TctC